MLGRTEKPRWALLTGLGVFVFALMATAFAAYRRRRSVVEEVVGPLRIVNGGGTGSLEVTGADPALTELAAGSGLIGPTLFDGYDADPDLTRETLQDGWFVTSDLGRFDGERLEVLGRVDDMVISGGTNIPTPAVARRLRDHLAISHAEVAGVDDEEWGQRVVAFVVSERRRRAG